MKLTGRGADYLITVLLLAAAGIVSGWVLFAALALALGFSSVVSLAMVRVRARSSVEARVTSGPLRLMKGEEGKVLLSVPGLKDPWAHAEVGSAEADGPVRVSLVNRGEDGLELTLKPFLAGRHTEVSLGLTLEDALGLVRITRSATLEGVVVDSLPLSLVAPLRRAFIPPLVVGESPAGTAGRGLEFFGVETYTERSESKDILWNRAAKEPDKPLLARVREADSPESVVIELVHGVRPTWALVDLQCEALGALGRALILAGIRTEVVSPDGARRGADIEEELAEVIMQASVLAPAPPKPPSPTSGPDILMLVGDVKDEALVGVGKPTVLIGGSGTRVPDRHAVAFTGSEDLSRVLGMVLAR